jgi:mRNA interferase MazF
MKRGAVVLASFPFTDLSATKRRPAVVVSKGANSNGDVIVAFITSVVPEKLLPTDLLLSPGRKGFEGSGLQRISIVKADKLATLNRSVISGELGKLSPSILKELDSSLKEALDLT